MGVQATATVDAGTASGTNALAVGSTSEANGEEAVAIGSSKATADYTIAIGDGAVAMSSGEIAIGKGAGNDADNRTNDDNAISIGTSARSRGAGGVALGNQAYSNLAKAVAIGDSAKANGENSVAIGSGAVVTTIDGVALGSNSTVGRATGAAGGPRWRTSTDIGSRWYTWAAAKNSTEGTDGTWTSTIDTGSTVWQSNLGAVSIGTDGLTGTTYTRQLTGLAAGTQDTDAVNVAQWKNTMLATIGDAKEDSANTRYGSDGVARNVTRLVDEYLTLTGAADDGTTLTKDQLTTDANIGTIVGDNKITFRLAKDLKGLDSVTTGNTVMNSTGLTITNTDDNTKNITLNGTNGNAVIGGVTVGYAADGALKYTDVLSGNVVNDAPGGTYVYGLSNTQWDGTTYVSGRAATEDQLYYLGNKAEQDINNLANQIGDGTFGLTADDGYSVQTSLGSQITVNGDGKNITTKTNDGALEIDLSNNLDLGNAGSVQMGNTTINNSGVTITHTDTDGNSNNVSLTENGLSNGGNAITNVGSGGTTETNAANIGDVKKLATTVTGGTNTTVTSTTNSNGGTEYQVDLKNKVTLGSNPAKQIVLDGDSGLVKAGTNITLDGVNSRAYIGGVNVGHTAAGALSYRDASGNVVTDQTVPAGNYVYSLGNTTWDGSHYVSGRAATEDQLHTVQANVNTAISNVDKHHTEVTVNGGTAPAIDGTYTDGNLQIAQTTGTDGQKIYDLKLSDNLSIGGAGQNGQDGSNGHMDINGADGKSGVSLDGQDGISIKGADDNSRIQISQGNVSMGGQQIHNVANGTADTDAVNLSQLNEIKNAGANGGFGLAADDGNSVKKNLGETVTVKGDGTNISTKVDNGAIQVELKKDIDLGRDGSVTAGETTISKDGVDTNQVKVGDITITKDGINGGQQQITNIGSGIDGKVYDTNTAGQENWNNAASVGDVHTIARDEASKAADAVKAKSGKNITVDADNKVNLNDDITLGDVDDASKQVKIDGNKAQITLGGKTVLGNQDGGGANPDAGSYLTGLDNKTWDASNIQSGRAATEDQLKVVDDKISGGRKFTGDDGQQLTVGLGQNLSLTGGAQADNLSDGNIGVVKNGDSGLSVKLSKDLKNLNSVTTGNTTIDNNGLTIKSSDADRTISIADGNVNMGGNTVSGVADGQVAPGSTDAVNGGQLWQRDQAINSLGGAVNKLDSRVNRVGAGAAALAALHPLDFDPDDKWDFAAGYGNYKDASAVAVGAYYRPNEDTMFSIGGSFGGGENMVNAGVSFKLGQGNHVSTSRVAMAKEIKDLRKEIEGLRSALADVAAGNRLDPTKTKLFPDIPQNHWAYNEIAQLYGNGIVQGYPDGNFGGDRMMTRYEFALMVYRQMQRGAALSDRIVNEFEPELERIRIDTITKDKDGNPVIQRVRVIKDRG